jgi:peptide/nickel transport system substrate-binding protein
VTEDLATDTSTQNERALSRRRFLEIAGAAGVGLGLAGALPGRSEAQMLRSLGYEANDRTLTWAINRMPVSLDSFNSFSADALVASTLLVDTLVTIDTKLQVVPALAESVKQVSKTEYLYTLRANAKFWDGSPVTSADVAYSLARHLAPASLLSPQFRNVYRIVARGPRTVAVILKSPDVTWKYTPAIAGILKKDFAKAQGSNSGAPGSKPTLMASGPYILKSFGIDGIVMERNEKYWGPKPSVQQFKFTYITDDAARLLAIQSGQIDGTFVVPVATSDQWASARGVNVTRAPGFETYYMAFDLAMPVFRDIRIRRAFAYAYDSRSVAGVVLKGAAQPATSLVPLQQWAGIASRAQRNKIYASLPTYKYDLAKARAELARSTRPSGFSTSVRVPQIPDLIKTMEVFAASLKQIGIDLGITVMPSAAFVAYVNAHVDLGLTSVSLIGRTADPVEFMRQQLLSTNAVVNGFNRANYKNNTVDKLLAAQVGETNDAKRRALLAKVLNTIGRELPYLPLWYKSAAVAVRDDVKFKGLNALFFERHWADGVTG